MCKKKASFLIFKQVINLVFISRILVHVALDPFFFRLTLLKILKQTKCLERNKLLAAISH